jgi:preprotein translocase subunit SecF
MGQRKLALVFSLTLILISIGSLAIRGLNFGIDFTGGTVIEMGYPDKVVLQDLRTTLAAKGFDDVTIQHFGTSKDVLVRIAPRKDISNVELSNKVISVLKQQNPKVENRRIEFVGPQVGDELKEQGGLAMLWAIIGILIYVFLRFSGKMAFGSVIALVHDVTIVLGLFSVFQLDFDLTVLAAVLAVIGYSLNDTIVVFDRIRENFRILRKRSPVEAINISINETLSRTIITSLTTVLVLVALFFLGGELIHNFATALLTGIVIGTYSSIYVASTSAVMLGLSKQDLMQVQKEGVGEDRP